MKKSELLRSKEYWLTNIQNDLFGVIYEYMKKRNLNRTKLAKDFKVSKGYISQVLNGDFDHKLSKFVELSLASGKAPILKFYDLDQYVIQNETSKPKYTETSQLADYKPVSFEIINNNIYGKSSAHTQIPTDGGNAIGQYIERKSQPQLINMVNG